MYRASCSISLRPRKTPVYFRGVDSYFITWFSLNFECIEHHAQSRCAHGRHLFSLEEWLFASLPGLVRLTQCTEHHAQSHGARAHTRNIPPMFSLEGG